MAAPQQETVRNRLLSELTVSDFDLLQPHLQPALLDLRDVVLRVREPIRQVIFIERGVISCLANTVKGRVGVGMIGSEGLVGLPVVLGVAHSPHECVVHRAGEGFRIAPRELRAAIDESPSMQARFLRYIHFFLVQVSQAAYANASFTVEARLARCILMTHDRTEDDELPLTHVLLSMMLGVRRSGVTVAVQVLEGNRLIRAARGRITVLDRAGLEVVAGAAYGFAEAEYDNVMGQPEPE